MKTKSARIADDIVALLRARNPLIWIITREEARVERFLFEAAAAARYASRTWDVAEGVCDLAGKPMKPGTEDIATTLNLIRDAALGGGERSVWILRDMPAWLAGPLGMTTLRQVRNLARALPGVPLDNAQAMIVLSPSGEVPPELTGPATVINWPLPDRDEIAALLDAAVAALPADMKASAAPNGDRDAAIDAAVGLGGEEAQACYAKSLVQFRKINPAAVAAEKKMVIARERLLEWFDPLPGGLSSVGGLDALKAWLTTRSAAYSPQARAYGLPAPRGILLVGVPGCGKSMTAKAVATAWNVPLLRLDLGSLKSKFVGESEANLRRALRVIESVGRCVVWVDEVEKALQGASSGSADGGVSADALGALLSWMQDRVSEAFVIATANNVETLPPELLRKGRFDELFFVDLPDATERAAVLKATLHSHGRGDLKIDTAKVVAACDQFTGAEIASLVPEAMFAAFGDGGRELTTDDLIAAARSVVPIAKTAPERIERVRAWGHGRARPATSTNTAPAERRKQVRALDF